MVKPLHSDAELKVSYVDPQEKVLPQSFQDLSKDTVITISEWNKRMQDASGINQEDTASLACGIITDEVFMGLINAKEGTNPFMVFDAWHNLIDSFGKRTALDSVEIETSNAAISLYMAKGYPIYAFSNILYYDDTNGNKHVAGTYKKS